MTTRKRAANETSTGQTHPCPFCGSRSLAAILYGEPDPTSDLMERSRRGEIVLGGCIVRKERFACNGCGTRFG